MKQYNFPDRKLIYVAGPYGQTDPVANTHWIIQVAEEILELGYTPIVPHLSLLWHLVSPHEVDFWYNYDLAILARCDAMYRFPGLSSGSDNEVKYAESKGIPVFYSLYDLNKDVPR